ncbi:putative nitroreductase [Variovorax paradoxus B4]|uniref:Putative nitroreductase n=1 Tax=Variovorax paradoxus B4 TaxID=1246301 RepID=T1XFK9_VARPD|nr:nitroreductase [Variovorax paradoxus]AGU50905.1 putative nitroreductase [Variovorax paradoxus B4]
MPSSIPRDPSLAPAFKTLLADRYSCRGYLAEPVARETIDAILQLAQRTASWCNSQPWQVTVTSAAATERLRHAFDSDAAAADAAFDIAPPTEYRGVYRERRRECGFQLYESVGIARGDREASQRQAQENFRFFGAPHLALVTTESLLGTYGALDCGAYVNNFMLAARSLGVASIAQAAVASRSKLLHRWFDIPDDRQVVCGIAFGYEDPSHPANQFRTSRAPLEEACRWVD